MRLKLNSKRLNDIVDKQKKPVTIKYSGILRIINTISDLDTQIQPSDIIIALDYEYILGILDENNIIVLSCGWIDTPDDVLKNILEEQKLFSYENFSENLEVNINPVGDSFGVTTNPVNLNKISFWKPFKSIIFKNISDRYYSLIYNSEISLCLDLKFIIDINGGLLYYDPKRTDPETVVDIIKESFAFLIKNEQSKKNPV